VPAAGRFGPARPARAQQHARPGRRHELFAADPTAAGVASCRDCHAQAGKKPKLMPKIPSLKDPETGKTTKLTSELAFHQRCDTCHYQILFQTPGAKAPDVTNCSTCHKK